MSRQCQHDECRDDFCSKISGAAVEATPVAKRPKPETDALKIVEERLKSYPLVSLNIQDLLLLDIARSLRVQTELAKAGLEFSHSLADEFNE